MAQVKASKTGKGAEAYDVHILTESDGLVPESSYTTHIKGKATLRKQMTEFRNNPWMRQMAIIKRGR